MGNNLVTKSKLTGKVTRLYQFIILSCHKVSLIKKNPFTYQSTVCTCSHRFCILKDSRNANFSMISKSLHFEFFHKFSSFSFQTEKPDLCGQFWIEGTLPLVQQPFITFPKTFITALVTKGGNNSISLYLGTNSGQLKKVSQEFATVCTYSMSNR